MSSYNATDGLSASSSWCWVPSGAHDQILISLFDSYFFSSRCSAPSPISPMKRVIQPEVKVKSQSYVSVGRNFQCYHWESCMGSMQCNVEIGYQLSICSGIKENHGKPWSSWPVAGPSGCKLASMQQSGIKSASPNISPYLCCCVFLLFCFLSFFNKFLATDPEARVRFPALPKKK
jgi:hypothetical protein